MYRFVRLSCSPPIPVEADEAGGGGAVLRLVERVPPADPVLDDDEDAVLAGEAAVGTRVPVVAQPPPIVAPEYCNKISCIYILSWENVINIFLRI